MFLEENGKYLGLSWLNNMDITKIHKGDLNNGE